MGIMADIWTLSAKWKTQFIVDQFGYASGLADLYGDRA